MVVAGGYRIWLLGMKIILYIGGRTNSLGRNIEHKRKQTYLSCVWFWFLHIYQTDGDIRSIVWQSSCCENISWDHKLLLETMEEVFGLGRQIGSNNLVGIYCVQVSWYCVLIKCGDGSRNWQSSLKRNGSQHNLYNIARVATGLNLFQ